MRNLLLRILPYNFRNQLGRIKRYIKYAFHLNLSEREQLKKCPICNTELAMFLPSGNEKKPIHCPNCSSFPRHRALWLYMKSQNLLDSNLSILHISPEPSFFSFFKSYPNYIGIDKFADGYAYHNSVARMDIEHLEFNDNSFDLVICSHVLEHVENDYNALKELARVTKPNGSVLVMVPIEVKFVTTYEDKSIIAPKERLLHFGQEDHVRLYGMDFPSIVESCGFECTTIRTDSIFNSEEFTLYGIEDDFIFHLKPIKL